MSEEYAMPVTPEQARQLSLEIGAYQAHFMFHSLLGDTWTNLAEAAEAERELAERLVEAVEERLKPIEARIRAVGDADEHVHGIAGLLGEQLDHIGGIGPTSIRLSTDALGEYWIPMMTENRP